MRDFWLPTARFSDLDRRESICFGLLFSTGLQALDAGDANIFPRMFRESLLLEDKQVLWLGVAWMYPENEVLFKQFPEVLKMDTTFKTNNERRPLLTISSRDSDGKVIVVLEAFLPNECTWIFRWILMDVLLAMLGTEHLARVKMIITDGDTQEMTMVDSLIKERFPNIIRQRCDWHLITRGFERNVIKLGSAQQKFVLSGRVCVEVLRWLYSFSKGGTETTEEFNISMALLHCYVTSKESILGTDLCSNILKFIAGSIEPFTENFCFHKRIYNQDFGESSNSSAESHHRAIKHSSTATLPQHSIFKAVQNLSMYQTNQHKARQNRLAAEMESRKLQALLKASQDLTGLGASLLESEFQAQKLYSCCQISNDVYHVVNIIGDDDDIDSARFGMNVPVFDRVWVVEFNADRTASCSCGYYQHLGIPCRHILHVMVETYQPLSDSEPVYEPRAADVAPRWHLLHKRYAFAQKLLPESSWDECKKMETVALNEMQGPRVRHIPKQLAPASDQDAYQRRHAADSCRNYSRRKIAAALRERARASSAGSLDPAGLMTFSFGIDDEPDYTQRTDNIDCLQFEPVPKYTPQLSSDTTKRRHQKRPLSIATFNCKQC
jgi:MULE transposase domain/SWIM zinc finger